MSDFSVIVWALLSALVGAVVLYVVIRLAVTHALRAYNRSPAPASEAEAGDRIRDRKFFG
jgi:hypothetical protein